MRGDDEPPLGTNPVRVPTTESTFVVPKMDCPSEERMIRLALEPLDEVVGLRFDLDERTVAVFHRGSAQTVLAHLEPLGFGAQLEQSKEASSELPVEDPIAEAHVLRQLLAINGVMFVAELGFGWWAQSTGLIADALDMLADSMVYGLALYAVGRQVADQRRAARASGWLQGLLAVGALAEVGRLALVGSEPVEALMIGVASPRPRGKPGVHRAPRPPPEGGRPPQGELDLLDQRRARQRRGDHRRPSRPLHGVGGARPRRRRWRRASGLERRRPNPASLGRSQADVLWHLLPGASIDFTPCPSLFRPVAITPGYDGAPHF